MMKSVSQLDRSKTLRLFCVTCHVGPYELVISIQTSLRKKTDSCGLMSELSKGTKNMIIPSSSRRPFGAWFITFHLGDI